MRFVVITQAVTEDFGSVKFTAEMATPVEGESVTDIHDGLKYFAKVAKAKGDDRFDYYGKYFQTAQFYEGGKYIVPEIKTVDEWFE